MDFSPDAVLPGKNLCIDEAGEVWKVIAFCDRPTLTLERVKDSQRQTIVEGSRIAADFRALVPEPTDDEKREKVRHAQMLMAKVNLTGE